MRWFYQKYEKGDFKPLINILITRMWLNQEGFTYQGFEKKLKEIPGPTDTFKFVEQLLESLEYAVESGKYVEIAGAYYPNPYKQFNVFTRAYCREKIDLIGISEKKVENILENFGKMLGIEYKKEKTELSQEQKEMEELRKWCNSINH